MEFAKVMMATLLCEGFEGLNPRPKTHDLRPTPAYFPGSSTRSCALDFSTAAAEKEKGKVVPSYQAFH
jgi:hypothetical protein